MKKNMILALFTVLCMVTLQSCQEEKTDDTARVQLRLVDASGDYEEVNVEIIDIQYKSSENEYITQTTTDEKGAFLIQGLQPGKYMIMIDELKYQPFTSELIEVEAGMVKDAGSILLKIPVN